MKLWLSKNSEIPIREQLIAQVRVAVAAGDLKAGDRLPSTRALARRFGIHPNTVSAAYRELARNGDVSKQSGCGVFVAEANGRGDALDDLIEVFFGQAATCGFSKRDVAERILNRLQTADRPAELVLFEPNADLAEIIVHEIVNATGSPVSVVGPDSIAAAVSAGRRLIAMADEKAKIAELIPEGSGCEFLSANSVALSMAGETRPSPEDIVAVASAWDDFLKFARLFLIAAKVDADSIVSVSTKRRGWRSKLRAASVIICDSVVADRLAGDVRVRVFPLISQAAMDELLHSTPR